MTDRQGYGWIFATVALFATVYAGSLTFVTVEGDGAVAMAYHALGRNAALQRPYSAWQGMMDVLLGILPADEPILRFVSISLTAAASLVMALLMLTLAFCTLEVTSPRVRLFSAIVLLMAVPEFFFLGLVYIPSVWAMCCVLAAHLLLLRGLGPARFAVSLALFAFGAACRWDIVSYGAAIAAHIAVGLPHDRAPWSSRVARAALWGVLALALWVVAVATTGTRPATIANILLWAPSERSSYGRIWGWGVGMVAVANLLSLITPAFLLLTTLGWLRLVRDRNRLALVVVLAALPVLPWLIPGIPKRLLPAVPMAVVCLVNALHWIIEDAPTRTRRVGVVGLSVLLIQPWLIGVRATWNDFAWGPGFELRPYDRPSGRGMSAAATLGAGAAMPSFEGPRPLWGYGAVLLGGGWRHLVTSRSDENRSAITYAITHDLPLLILQTPDADAVATLSEMEFRTTDPTNFRNGPPIVRRRFTRPDGSSVVTLCFESAGIRDLESELIKKPDELFLLAQKYGIHQVVVCGYNPSAVRLLFRRIPSALSKLGPSSLVLDLDRWREAR